MPPSSRPNPLPFPWPRSAPDGTPLGVDLAAPSRHKGSATVADDVRRIVLKHFHPADVDPEDLVGEVYAAIARKNRQACAFDPRRAGLSKYIWRVAYGVCSNQLGAQRRWTDVVDARPEVGDPSGGEDEDGPAGWVVGASVTVDIEDVLDQVRALRAGGAPLPPAPWVPSPAPWPPPPALWEQALASRALGRSRGHRRGAGALWAAWVLYPWTGRRPGGVGARAGRLRLLAPPPGQLEMWTVVAATVGRARPRLVVSGGRRVAA